MEQEDNTGIVGPRIIADAGNSRVGVLGVALPSTPSDVRVNFDNIRINTALQCRIATDIYCIGRYCSIGSYRYGVDLFRGQNVMRMRKVPKHISECHQMCRVERKRTFVTV